MTKTNEDYLDEIRHCIFINLWYSIYIRTVINITEKI